MDGCTSVSTTVTQTHVMVAVESKDDGKLSETVRKFWELDSIGVLEEKSVDPVERHKNEIQYDGEKYTVAQPWKPDVDDLPDHYLLCKGRLNSLFKRLKANPELLAEYDGVIREVSLV